MVPRKMIGVVSEKRHLAGNNWLIKIGFPEPQVFIPGQYVSLRVNNEGMRRSYSVASLPGREEIELLIDVSPMGVGSKFVLGLKLGDEVDVLGYLGDFVINEESLERSSEVLLVATGTGIGPVKPMLEDLLKRRGYRKRVVLIWGMRYREDLYWVSELERLAGEFANLEFVLTLTRPDSSWQGTRGRVGEVVGGINMNMEDVEVYLCGSKEMIENTKEILVRRGVSDMRVNYEKYY